jgi:hypothetical protein
MLFCDFSKWSASLLSTSQHVTTSGSGPTAAADSKQNMAEAAARQQKTKTLAKLYDGKLRLERRNRAPRPRFRYGALILYSRPEAPGSRS